MIEMTIPAMSCGHCVQTIRRTLEATDPGARVEVDLATRKVRVDGATQPVERLHAALAEEGYPPQV